MKSIFKEKVSKMRIINTLALVLLIIGGINWALYGLFDVNLVSAIFGVDTILSTIVYALVGASAVYSIFLLKPVSHINEPHGHFVSR